MHPRKRVQDEIAALRLPKYQERQPQAALDKWEEHIKPMYEKVNAVRLTQNNVFALDTHHVAFVEKWASIFDTLNKWGLWRDQVVYSYAMVDLQDKIEHINSITKRACTDSTINDFAIHASMFGNYRNEENGLGKRLKAFNKFNADRYLFTDSKTIGKIPGWTVVQIQLGKDVNGIPAGRVRCKEIKFRGHALLKKYRYRIHVDAKRNA